MLSKCFDGKGKINLDLYQSGKVFLVSFEYYGSSEPVLSLLYFAWLADIFEIVFGIVSYLIKGMR
jgi:hypothetical protein